MVTQSPDLSAHLRATRLHVNQSRRGRLLASVEVIAAAAAVIADVLIPALVLLAMAATSLALRHAHPRSLGLVRPAKPWRLCGTMLGFAAAWTLLSLALFIPVSHHLSGQRQDTSAFTEVQGNAGMLAVLLLASWTLAAFGEEVAFRGYLLTRLIDAMGSSRLAIWTAVLVSSTLFGLIHTEQGLVGVILATIDGCAFAVLRLRSGTVWSPVLAHGFINTIGFVAFYFVGPVPGLW